MLNANSRGSTYGVDIPDLTYFELYVLGPSGEEDLVQIFRRNYVWEWTYAYFEDYQFILPNYTSSGWYYFRLVADVDSYWLEENENDNESESWFEITVPPPAPQITNVWSDPNANPHDPAQNLRAQLTFTEVAGVDGYTLYWEFCDNCCHNNYDSKLAKQQADIPANIFTLDLPQRIQSYNVENPDGLVLCQLQNIGYAFNCIGRGRKNAPRTTF